MRDLTLRGWQGWRVRPADRPAPAPAPDRLAARGRLGPLEPADADGVRRGLVERVRAAIAAGQVGERADGYLGIRGSVGGDVRAEVEQINIKRRALYTERAQQRGVAQLNAVTLFAAR